MESVKQSVKQFVGNNKKKNNFMDCIISYFYNRGCICLCKLYTTTISRYGI